MIEASAVTVRAGTRTLLDGVSLTAATGTVTGIVGPNGSGKTTLLRALVRAVRMAGGRIVVDGHDLSTRRRRWIARRVAEVSLGGLAERGVLRVGGSALDEEVAAAIDTVGLTPRAFDRLATLSGGELQRVALARALAQRAPHVLLDEPTNHLDLRHRLEVVALLRTIAPTVVVVLHDLDLAAQACDHLVLLHHGRVAAAGPPREVLHPELIDRVYDVNTTRHDDPAGRIRFDFSLPPQRHHHPDTKEST
jgi:iron complex transport system ATP-binding protein